MIRTPICSLLDIEHPIALGGMGSATSPPLAAAVSQAGGLGALWVPLSNARTNYVLIQNDRKPF
jgi:NAD(P)H-dependent flavin oxidoreductase YrpB (nitropropane dioxygenase family)